MASTSFISWTVLKEEDLAEARQTLAEIQARSTVDVLNLGIPLEAISDLCFPGSSTLHTHFRYVVFVPAIIYAMHHHGASEGAFASLKKAEGALIKSLKNGGMIKGLLGRIRDSQDKELRYPPSTTYWSAFNRYKLFGDYRDQKDVLRSIDERREERPNEDEPSEHYGIDPNPKFLKIAERLFMDPKKLAWKDKLTFDLERSEAEYFRDIIETDKDFSASIYKHMLKMKRKYLANVPTLFKLKVPDPEYRLLLDEAEKYSRLAMGITLAYRGALSEQWEEWSREDKEVTEAEEWAKAKEQHRAQLDKWIHASGDIEHWSFAKLTRAYSAFTKKDPIGPHLARMDDKGLEEYCDTCRGLIFGRGKNRFSALKEKMKGREQKVRGNSSRFLNTEIDIPQSIRKAPEEQDPYLYQFRWEVGRDNIVAILTGLER